MIIASPVPAYSVAIPKYHATIVQQQFVVAAYKLQGLRGTKYKPSFSQKEIRNQAPSVQF